MRGFKNILVCVDLSQGDRWVSDDLPPPTVEAINRSLWLAKLNDAQVTFFYAIDLSHAAQTLIDQESGGEQSVIDKARDLLSALTTRAKAEGVKADLEVCIGKSWLEIIRRVLRHKHDLVVAGTRHLGTVKGFFMGSTGIKLLRKCPCPVWITQPQSSPEIKTILVAHDLRPVGDLAMGLGCSMAQLHGAQLHVLHSLELSEVENTLPECIPAEKMAKYRSDATQHIESQLMQYNLEHEPHVHIVTAPPDRAILDCIRDHNVELLTMATVGRTGIAGFITGSTAERLLPQIPCSVLALKPTDFISPVKLEA